MSEDKESWERIGQHVIKTLERMEEKIESLDQKMNSSNLDTHVEITTLKVKAGLWGTIAGIITSAIVSIVVGYIVYNVTKGPQYYDHPKPKQEHSLITPRDNERIFSINGRTFIV